MSANTITTTMQNSHCRTMTTNTKVTQNNSHALLEQHQELETLQMIFPDTFSYHFDNDVGYSGVLQVPIELDSEHPIAASTVTIDATTTTTTVASEPCVIGNVRHLPPIVLSFTLSHDYPSVSAPQLTLNCEWLNSGVLNNIENNLIDAWSDIKDAILFQWKDILNDIPLTMPLAVPLVFSNDHAQRILDYNQMILDAEFARTLHSCPVCLEEIRGQKCFRLGCGHVFCTTCLVDYFTLLIREGQLEAVRCPDTSNGHTVYNPTVLELQQIVGAELQKRFADLKERRSNEANPAIFWCPRPTCQGPALCEALVPKHATSIKQEDVSQVAQLAVCRRCNFCFCISCRRSWHGPANPCDLPNTPEDRQELAENYAAADKDERLVLEKQYGRNTIRELVRQTLDEDAISEDEGEEEEEASNTNNPSTSSSTRSRKRIGRTKERKESRAWIQSHTKKCPHCRSPIQKNAGCNRIRCSICSNSFCWLCNELLSVHTPYEHYSDASSRCYNKCYTDDDQH